MYLALILFRTYWLPVLPVEDRKPNIYLKLGIQRISKGYETEFKIVLQSLHSKHVFLYVSYLS